MKTNTPIGADVRIHAGGVNLDGILSVPKNPSGLVLFSHGSGSSRYSQRNQFVARCLHERGLGTLLFDLLTREEESIDSQTRQIRFNIELLAARLLDATRWVMGHSDLSLLPIAYFGASTGAAAALIAAAELPKPICAVVSRGGRPDLATTALPRVRAPTLLIVGGADDVVIDLNKTAQSAMIHAETKLAIVPGATHLFEEPGALVQVAELAGDWIEMYLGHNTARQQQGESMDVVEAIHHRNATRSFSNALVPDALIHRLLSLAIEAPSAKNVQPWAFVVTHDKALMAELSSRAKARLLRDSSNDLMGMRDQLAEPTFNIFYGAPVLVVICSTSKEAQAARDCYLAGENLMLAATGLGLSTCPIGFAWSVLADDDVRKRLAIPEDYEPVLPIVVGYHSAQPELAHSRNKVDLLHWD